MAAWTGCPQIPLPPQGFRDYAVSDLLQEYGLSCRFPLGQACCDLDVFAPVQDSRCVTSVRGQAAQEKLDRVGSKYSILIGCLFALQGSAPCGNFPQVIKGNFLAPFDGGFEPIGDNRTRRRSAADVRFGSKADMCSAKRHVRFTPESGHVRCTTLCPLSANSGHSSIHSTTSSAICWRCTGADQYRNSSVRLTRHYQADQDMHQRYSALAPSLKLLAMIAQPMALMGLIMTAQAPQSLPSSSSLSSLCSLFKYGIGGCSFEAVIHL